jgi:hypothetical protein
MLLTLAGAICSAEQVRIRVIDSTTLEPVAHAVLTIYFDRGSAARPGKPDPSERIVRPDGSGIAVVDIPPAPGRRFRIRQGLCLRKVSVELDAIMRTGAVIDNPCEHKSTSKLKSLAARPGEVVVIWEKTTVTRHRWYHLN